MKKIVRNIQEVLKQSASEIMANWKFSQLVQGRSKKMKMYVLVYMNTGFFLVYASLCFISILYILFGIIGGTILGITESPYWFLLFLLPVAALPFLYFVHNIWTSYYPGFQRNIYKNIRFKCFKRNEFSDASLLCRETAHITREIARSSLWTAHI